ncbi:DUF3054 domain-containing protein [Pseudonocardia sp.]|uniref:DUF3054 domain-containing protein n=1 Tax=Pseudonocardia sp. TaxID=60912 RepID=UPI003D12AD36
MNSRIPVLALAADAVAVVVFAAVGRSTHAEPGDLLGLLTAAAPFLVAVLASRAFPPVRLAPTSLRAGLVVVGVTAAGGLLLRAAVTGRLPLTFVLVATASLAVLLLGWRGLSALVARRVARHRARLH